MALRRVTPRRSGNSKTTLIVLAVLVALGLCASLLQHSSARHKIAAQAPKRLAPAERAGVRPAPINRTNDHPSFERSVAMPNMPSRAIVPPPPKVKRVTLAINSLATPLGGPFAYYLENAANQVLATAPWVHGCTTFSYPFPKVVGGDTQLYLVVGQPIPVPHGGFVVSDLGDFSLSAVAASKVAGLALLPGPHSAQIEQYQFEPALPCAK
jgi:hypothetical protein